MNRSDAWKQRPAVLRYHAYRDELRLRLPGYVLPDELEIEFTMPTPPSWSAKRRSESEGKPHQSRPDVDNLLKGFMDAVATEDSHVWKVTASKVWGQKGQICVK